MSAEADYNQYDLHIHSLYSSCSSNKPAVILKTAKKLGLNGIAVTDHNSIEGSIKTKKLNKDRDFEVIIAEEVRTNAGDILAYYLNEQINSRDITEVLDNIRSQGGIACIAHPFSTGIGTRPKFKPTKEIIRKLDAIEAFNAKALFLSENRKAELLGKKLNLACIAGSDAHFSWEIGHGITLSKSGLVKDIRNKKTLIQGKLNSPFGKLFSGILMIDHKVRKLLK